MLSGYHYISIFGKNLFSDSKAVHEMIFFLLTVCDEMWYGVNCSQRCAGHCKDNDTCNYVTGQCDRGCDAGWTQSDCDKGMIILCLWFIWCILIQIYRFGFCFTNGELETVRVYCVNVRVLKLHVRENCQQ